MLRHYGGNAKNKQFLRLLVHPWAGEDLRLKIDERDQTILISTLEL